MTEELGAWEKTHSLYLEAQLYRMRLLIRRRILWLRSHGWHTDPTSVDPDARADRLAAVHAGPDAQPGTAVAEMAELTRAVQAWDSRLADYEAELVQLSQPSGISALCSAVGMEGIEREAVVAALCAELDPAIGDLFAYLQDDSTRRYATPGLVASLLDRSISEGWLLLDPAGPTMRFRIFRPEPGGARAALRLDRRMIGYLRGRNYVDEALAGLVSIMPAIPIPGRHEHELDRIVAWLADTEREPGPVTLNLVGPSVETQRVFAARLLRAVNLNPLRLHIDRLAGRPERRDLIKLVEREAVLLPAGVYVEPAGGHSEGPATVESTRELIEDLDGLVVIGSRERWNGNRTTVVVPVPGPDSSDRLAHWEAALGGPVEGLNHVVEQFCFGPESIWAAAEEAAAIRQIGGGTEVTADDLWLACRRFVGRELGELATRLEGGPDWEDIILPSEQLSTLREVAAQVRNRSQVYEEWNFGAKLTRGRGISALFTGPPGTGKTMAAEVISRVLELDLYRIDLASMVSKYIGETEKNLRRVFDAAEQSGAILFFDEADALFGKRTEVKDSHDRFANVEISYLLQRMEQYAGLAILATNRKSDLDPAFLRRIRFLVVFPFPSVADRRRIWDKVFPPELPREELDFDHLARLELAGGNIKNIALNAAFLAADLGRPVKMAHMMQAALHEYRKMDKLPTRNEFGIYYEAHRS